ncbi:hypothetical protein L210DRAFT_935325 [Boletus edulis BED1]|uniref:Uncharacterized protein n=1 Tax=Boletus edulis BED1 TaxID=1328754 RepID=A0AAD4BJZ2_BOLED|nr:hypothetical protein L210DRAFT_935325 [Boletus edulis BED1]
MPEDRAYQFENLAEATTSSNLLGFEADTWQPESYPPYLVANPLVNPMSDEPHAEANITVYHFKGLKLGIWPLALILTPWVILLVLSPAQHNFFTTMISEELSGCLKTEWCLLDKPCSISTTQIPEFTNIAVKNLSKSQNSPINQDSTTHAIWHLFELLVNSYNVDLLLFQTEVANILGNILEENSSQPTINHMGHF